MRKKEVRYFFKQNIFASLTQIFIFIFLLLFNILLARILGPYNFGIFIVVFSMALMVGMFSDMGLSQVIMRYIGRSVRQKDSGAPSYFRHLFKIKLTMVVALSLALYFSSDFLAALLLHDGSLGPMFKIAGLIAAAYSFFIFLDSFFASLNRYDYSMLTNFISNASRLLLPVALLIMGFGVLEALYGILAAFLFSLVVAGYFFSRLFRNTLLKNPKKSVSLAGFDRFLMYSASIGILITAYNNLDTFILSFFRSPAEVSFYRTALSIATYTAALLPISGKFLFSAFVELEEKSKEFIKTAFNKTVRYTIIMAIPATVGVYVLSSKIVVLFYSSTYLPAAPALVILSPLVFTTLLNVLTLNFLMISGRLRKALIISAVVLSYSIMANIALIPIFGYMAAAFNALVMHVLFLSLGIYSCRDIIKIRIDFGSLFKTILSSAIMGLFLYALIDQVNSLLTGGPIIAVAALIYLVMQLAVGGITKSDISLMQRAVPCPLWGLLMKICRN